MEKLCTTCKHHVRYTTKSIVYDVVETTSKCLLLQEHLKDNVPVIECTSYLKIITQEDIQKEYDKFFKMMKETQIVPLNNDLTEITKLGTMLTTHT